MTKPMLQEETFVFLQSAQIYAYKKEKIQYVNNVIRTETKYLKN